MRGKKAKALRKAANSISLEKETSYKFVLANPHKPVEYTDKYMAMLEFETDEIMESTHDGVLATARRTMSTRILDSKCSRALYRHLKREFGS